MNKLTNRSVKVALVAQFHGRVGVVGNGVGHTNKVRLRRARLVLGLVTTFGGCTIPVFIHATQTHSGWSLSIRMYIGAMSHRWGRNDEFCVAVDLVIRTACILADMADRRPLRSSATNRLVVPSYRLSSVGSRAFPVAAAKIWNALPDNLVSATSLQTFRRHLKTFLFQQSFS